MIMISREKSDAKKNQFIGAKFERKMKYLSKKTKHKIFPSICLDFVKDITGIDKTKIHRNKAENLRGSNQEEGEVWVPARLQQGIRSM
uniref:Uncharacterized protein n=1 Tax=Aegilops tauschii subsp. strangulata TaxID=200361 RepID=A0A453LMK7_AEGTS